MNSPIVKVFALLVLAVVFSSGCKPKQRAVEGQVFVVLKNGQSIKLGLVPIVLMSRTQAVQHLSKTMAQIRIDTSAISNLVSGYTRALEEKERKLELAQGDCAVAKDAREAAFAVKTTISDNWNKYSEKYTAEQKATMRKRYSEAEKTWSDAEHRHVGLEGQVIALKGEIDALKELRRDTKRRAYDTDDIAKAFEGIPWTYQSVTDADGNFSLKVNDLADCVLFAKSERAILDSSEKYFWIVPLGTATNRILLNNANLAPKQASQAEELLELRAL